MANIATAPSNLSAAPKTQSAYLLHRHALASVFFHYNALDRIAVRTEHAHSLSQVIKYHCKRIYESPNDFEEKRARHEVTLPYRRLCFST